MAVSGRLDALIDQIYAAPLHPGSWGKVVADVGAALGATSATSLWFGQGGADLLRVDQWNVDPEALAIYQDHFLPNCPRYRASRDLEVGAVYDDRRERAAQDDRSRAYYDFMDRYDLGLAQIALAEKRPALTIGMNFYNRVGDGMSADGGRILAQLAPHFRRACNLTQTLGDVVERAALADAWFASRTASVTLDMSGNVVRLNDAAEKLLALADGLTMAKRRLVAASAADQDRLRAEIALALRTASVVETNPAGGFVLLTRPSGRPAYALSAIPLHGAQTRERVILTISQTVPHLPPEALRRAFGLTATEARITAALAEGKSPDQIALDRGVSLQTVRSQMKAIYSQLGVGSQAELVSRVTAAALGVRL